MLVSSLPHILVVDDHAEIRHSISRYLEKNQMKVSDASNSASMDKLLAQEAVSLIILDVMMPGEDGLKTCRRLRQERRDIPILMLTALCESEDCVKGLQAGADDYLIKPFEPRELLARINAVLRRAGKAKSTYGGGFAGRRVRFADNLFDHDTEQVILKGGGTTSLTTAEIKLLSVFLSNPRVVIDRDELLGLTAGRAAGPLDRTIDNQISRLRKKIEPDEHKPKIITTVRLGGYCLNCDVFLEP